MTTLLLIGCGNMGYAMLKGWLGADPDLKVHVVEPAEALRIANALIEEDPLRLEDRLLRIDGKRLVSGPADAARRIERAPRKLVEATVERAGLEIVLELRPPVVHVEELALRVDPEADRAAHAGNHFTGNHVVC